MPPRAASRWAAPTCRWSFRTWIGSKIKPQSKAVQGKNYKDQLADKETYKKFLSRFLELCRAQENADRCKDAVILMA
jgi:hypothetical protein